VLGLRDYGWIGDYSDAGIVANYARVALMSDPFQGSKPLRGLALEIISAQSSLNMYPEPIPPKEGEDSNRYLSDSDAWAKHSMEHLHQAFMYQMTVRKKLAEVYYELFRLGIDNPELDRLARKLAEMEDF